MVETPDYIERRFEHAPDKDGFFSEVWLDEANDREFTVTSESVVRISYLPSNRNIGAWSVSEHSLDFWEGEDGQMLTHPSRFDSENEARAKVDELVGERC